MIHKIAASNLHPGMYVIDPVDPSLKSDAVFSLEGELKTEHEVELIRKSGFREAYVDLLRSRPDCLSDDLKEILRRATSNKISPKGYVPPPPKVPLAEELTAARSIYSETFSKAREIMDGMRSGQISADMGEDVVEDILQSLDRNSDALFGLCKLRQADEYTYGHCVNVSVMAVMFARGLGLSEDAQRIIGMGGLFHDIGKARISLDIVNAPRKLTDEEFAVMKLHPVYGYNELIKLGNVPEEVLDIVRHHHERFNGKGYPDGLSGSDISEVGIMSAIVDVFDALSSKRVYKPAMPLQKVLGILYSMRGQDFPAEWVEQFIQLLGIYPLGSAIELEDGRRGVVSATNPANATHPKVILIEDAKRRRLHPLELDLAEGGYNILKGVPPDELPIFPTEILGITGGY